MAGSSTKVVVSAILGNSFITVLKFIGWFLSYSPSMLAEAIHSLADTLNQLLLLVGIKQSHKAPTRDHPVGSGEMQYVWNLISAVVIFFIGFGVTLYHGIHALLSPHQESTGINWIVIAVLVISLVIEGFIFIQAYKEVDKQRKGRSFLTFLRESDDPTILAVLIEDGIAVLGVSLALIGIVLGELFQSSLFDVITAIVIAFLLGFMAIAMAIINGKLLIGKSVAIHKEDEIKNFVQKLDEIQNVKSLNTQVLGSGRARLSINVHLYGEKIIDYKALEQDLVDMNAGEDKMKTLVKASERMIRLNAKLINEIEIKIQTKFPEIYIIDFEVN